MNEYIDEYINIGILDSLGIVLVGVRRARQRLRDPKLWELWYIPYYMGNLNPKFPIIP